MLPTASATATAATPTSTLCHVCMRPTLPHGGGRGQDRTHRGHGPSDPVCGARDTSCGERVRDRRPCPAARPGPIVAPAAGTAVAALRLPATALVAGHGIAVVIG
ncbi:hypothetical protein GCM10010210_27300 [Pseudonocardia hydrocarbonoxydans]|uniref:Uncharacterized protein n=1 Tax=Pseudonocardia hydrocarbonoxydans TaxID=76726 RepID=A0A4Y3WMP6_9PSEU|nr:hypothetical protein PHY01_23270 [Pseudonocardia hydrocarbonoxydans]